MHHLGVAGDDVGALFGAHGRVFKEAAGVANHRRVGQFGAPDLANPVKQLARCGLHAGVLGLHFFQVGVAQHRLPGFGQGKAHPQNQRPVFQPKAFVTGRVLEHRVAVAKAALRGVQGEQLSGLQVYGVQRIKAVLQLHAIGANVLHWRSTHRAGNKRQVFQPGQALVQRPGHKVVPVFAGAGFHDEVLGRLAQQRAAHDFYLEHQRLHVAGQHQVAAAAQHKLWLRAPLRVGAHGLGVGLGANAQQRVRLGHDMEGVERLKGNVFLD